VDTEILTIETGPRRGVFDLTSDALRFVVGKGDGLLNVFVPHATAGVAVIETGAGSDDDLMDAIDAMLPRDDRRYRHRHGSPGHGADHVLPGIVAPSMIIPVIDGDLALGTWQSIVLVDPNEDNRVRHVRLSFLKSRE
jgi:secondary thiamine-phosphate synthase enzyme